MLAHLAAVVVLISVEGPTTTMWHPRIPGAGLVRVKHHFLVRRHITRDTAGSHLKG